ncbi:hypothetical protein J2Z32_003727 [Paenibacillus turicensis]|uniref:Spore protein n=1 Tax=Paenibacillus turicensis TaxID=160487 RepID=A0ABS4FWX6_9BACL|nr:hypothetical protein [Paenibacillus turicensis]
MDKNKNKPPKDSKHVQSSVEKPSMITKPDQNSGGKK